MLLYLSFLALPYLAVSGATAFAEERDGNHFDLLCITLLDQRHLIQAKAARLLRLGLVMLLLPFVLQVLVLVLGWSRWSALVLNGLHCLAAAAFWLMLGMAIGLRMAKTVQAIVLTFAIGFVIGILVPWISMMIDEEKLLPVALCCSPAQCMFVQMMDNRVEKIGRPGGHDAGTIALVVAVLYAAVRRGSGSHVPLGPLSLRPVAGSPSTTEAVGRLSDSVASQVRYFFSVSILTPAGRALKF